MKIITATGGAAGAHRHPGHGLPVCHGGDHRGLYLQNANGEDCGGTLINSFAVSCNSVFAPLGAKLGAKRLVATAERFGFNQPSSIPGAAESTIPSAKRSATTWPSARRRSGRGWCRPHRWR